MFARLFSLLLLLGVVYVGAVFLAPPFADRYGNPEINTKIRSFKESYMTPMSGSLDTRSIVEKALSGAQSTITETEQTYTHIRNTIDEKTEQVQKTTESVKKAYEAIDEATENLNSLTQFSGSLKQ